MSLYDDAGMISLPTGAAGKDNKLYNIKPVEKLKVDELVTNGTFYDNDSEGAWSPSASSPTFSNNQVRFQHSGGTNKTIEQTGVFEEYKTYKVSLNVVEIKAGAIRIGTGYNSVEITSVVNGGPIVTPGNHSFIYTNRAQGATDYSLLIGPAASANAYDFTIDNVSVKEVEQEAKDFGFVRASSLTATRVGPGGLIEKGRENLLLQSNQFDTTWTKTLVTVSSGQSGFDGSSNAWLVTKTSTGSARLNQTSTAEGVFTYSCYAKAGTLNGVILRADSGSGNAEVQFDLTGDGSVYLENSNCIDSSITKIGTNGWFRCSLTSERTLTTVRIYPATETGALTSTGTIYIQNAQLEAGLVATDYIESHSTTGKAGILEDEPRFDHTGGGCPGLLLESQSVNKLPHSEYFESWTVQAGITLTTNTSDVKSPEGLYNATKVVSTDAGDGFYESGLSVASDIVHSIYLRGASGGETITLQDSSGYPSPGGQKSITLTDEWVRYDFPLEYNGTNAFQGMFVNNISVGTIYAWGAQMEEGSFVTSYIPNHGTSGGATRVRDDVGVLTDTTTDGLTNGYNTTIYCKFKLLADDRSTISGLVNYYPPVTGVQEDPRVLLYTGGSSGGTFKARLQYRMGNTGDNDQIIETPGTYNVGDEVKAVARITDYDITLFVNGTKFTFADHPTTATAGRPFKKSISGATMNGLDLTYSTTAAQHELYEVITFPKALTDDECEDLTTL